MLTRLQKIIADAGAASRRKAEEYIAAGRVAVNGKTVTELGVKADPEMDTVTLDGKPLQKADKKVYILLNKPEGVVTTVSDPQGRKTVLDLIPRLSVRIYPAGRLDYDSSGLLLLTNDGKLTFALTHPRTGAEKVYRVTVKGHPSPKALRDFAGGVYIDGKRTAPCAVKILKKEAGDAVLQVTLREGRNRQIRKMCEAIGHPVITLTRIAMGPLTLKDLPPGGWRYLTKEELNELTKLCTDK